MTLDYSVNDPEEGFMMDFKFTDTQELFRSDVKKFIESTLTEDFWKSQENSKDIL